MTIYITKYATTRGVIRRDNAELHPYRTGMAVTISKYEQSEYWPAGCWFRTPEAAAADVRKRLDAMAEKLNRQRSRVGEMRRLLGLGRCPGIEGVQA